MFVYETYKWSCLKGNLSKRQLGVQEGKEGGRHLGVLVTCSQGATQDDLNRKAICWKGTGWVIVLPSRACKLGKWVGTMGGQSTRAKAKVICHNQTVRILWISSWVGAWYYHHQYPYHYSPHAWERADLAVSTARMNSPRFYFSESFTPESKLLGATLLGLGHMPLS